MIVFASFLPAKTEDSRLSVPHLPNQASFYRQAAEEWFDYLDTGAKFNF